MRSTPLLKTRVVHGYRFIGARDVVHALRRLPRTCTTGPYLECLVEYHEVQRMCGSFAHALKDESLRDPTVFAQRVISDYYGRKPAP